MSRVPVAVNDSGFQKPGYLASGVLARAGRLLVLSFYSLVDFFAVDFGVFGGLNAQPYLLAFDLNYSNFDVIVDGNAFIQLSGQY
jgi:hypothetical protein